MTDVAQAIERLTQAARQAGHDRATGKAVSSEIPVIAARKELLHRLDRLGIDGGGWDSERERLNNVINDLNHRLEAMTRERDHALAVVDELEQADVLGALDRAALVIGGDEPDRSAERVDDERARWTA